MPMAALDDEGIELAYVKVPLEYGHTAKVLK